MTDKVYVVIAEEGEYSDRRDYIAGVFTDKAEAEEMVLEKSRWKAEQDALLRAWSRAFQERIEEFMDLPKVYDRLEAAEKVLGPRPETGDWDRLYLTEVPLNEWGRFKF